MNKKIYISLISALLVLSLALTSCGKENLDKEIKLNEKIQSKAFAYRTDLIDSSETLTTNKSVEDYLSNWAKSKNIKHNKDDYGNVIMYVPASEAYIDADPVVIVCSYDAASFVNCVDAISSALYAIKNNEETGELTVIFSPVSNGNFTAVQNLSSEYFSDDAKVISLSGASKALWSVNSGGYSNYTFTGTLSTTEPGGKIAYKISLSGLPSSQPDARISSFPNPIKMFGDLLASFKTNALIFELANISGGTSSSTYPGSAEMTIVISEDDIDKFTSKIDKSIERFNKKYSSDYSNAIYKYEQVTLPEAVYTKESLNTLISSIYTLVDGVYYRDTEDEIITIANLGMLSTSTEAFTILAHGYSLDKTNLTELDEQYATICSLAGINFSKVNSALPLSNKYTPEKESKFQTELKTAFEEYTGSELEFKNCVQTTSAIFMKEKNANLKLVNIVINEEKLEHYTGSIITILKNQKHKEIKKENQ